MSLDELDAVAPWDAPLLPPAPVIFTGLGAIGAGWLWIMMQGRASPTAGVLLVVVGLLLVGVGLAVHLSAAQATGRLRTAGWWLLAALAAWVSAVALEGPADSIAMLLRVFGLAALLAAALVAAPPFWRWVGVSALVAWHFFAIFTATTILPPPSGNPSWLATQLWTRFTRPYLQLTNLNNAYHFYAPEPGPVAVAWFRVRFADGAAVWVRLPDHEACRNHIERRRMGSLATSLTQSAPASPTDEQIRQRDEAARRYDPPLPPFSPAIAPHQQYHDPGVSGRLLLRGMSRYLARTTPHPGGGPAAVDGVRVYSGEFTCPPPEHFRDGGELLDPAFYRVWYLGEYDAEGELKPSSRLDMLHWLIPIYRAPASSPGRPGKLMNFLRIHAGDGNQEDMP